MREIEDEVRDIARNRENRWYYIKVVGTHSLDGKGYIDRKLLRRLYWSSLD